jgi:hypothetical protein
MKIKKTVILFVFNLTALLNVSGYMVAKYRNSGDKGIEKNVEGSGFGSIRVGIRSF